MACRSGRGARKRCEKKASSWPGDPRHRVGQRRRVRDQLADALAQELGVEELLGVLPLVQRLALVEPLVALQADEPPARDLGERLGQLGLAHARRALDEHRPAHALGEEHHGGDAAIGDVAGVLEVLLDVLRRLEHVGSCKSELARSVAHLRTVRTRADQLPASTRCAYSVVMSDATDSALRRDARPLLSSLAALARCVLEYWSSPPPISSSSSSRGPRRTSAMRSRRGRRTGGSPCSAAVLLIGGWASSSSSCRSRWLGGFWLPAPLRAPSPELRPLAVGPAKAALIGVVLGLAAVLVVYALLRSTPWWWLWAAPCSSRRLAPARLRDADLARAPLLSADPAARRRSPLAPARAGRARRRAGDRRVVVDQSRRSRTANAAVTGLGRTRRILLFDTLVQPFTPDEVEAVLAHELGHHVAGDICRGLAGPGRAHARGVLGRRSRARGGSGRARALWAGGHRRVCRSSVS